MEEPLQEWIRIDPDESWFLYVGEVKAAGLNRFLVDSISQRYGKPAHCIHIVPDVLAHYPQGRFLVVNPRARLPGCGNGKRYNTRIPASLFAAKVSNDPRVMELVRRILDIQGEVLVNVFESRKELKLGEGVSIIGPDPVLAETMNNKLNQREIASNLDLPLPCGGAFHDPSEAFACAKTVLNRGSRVFVSGAYSAAGSNSIIASSIRQIEERFGNTEGGLLVTEYIDHDHDPTVLGVVASDREVYIASVADQEIRGTRFTGSTFPTILDRATTLRLKEMTRTVGRRLGEMEYRGAFGCDYIVDRAGKAYFIEINARKQGTTMETVLTMAGRLPEFPSFPELELAAALGERFPGGLEEMDSTQGAVFWGTYNHKVEKDLHVEGYVPPAMDEVELFARAAAGGAGHIVVEHVGPDTRIAAGSFLARVIAVGGSRSEVIEGLKEGEKEILRSAGLS
jgi:hypothetical protein